MTRLLRWMILMLFSPFALALIFCVSGAIFLLAVWAGMSSYALMFAKNPRAGMSLVKPRSGKSTG